MALFLVFRAICKALLLMLSGANVVHFIDAKIRRRLIISFLRIVPGDPLGARTQDPNIKSVVLYQLS